METNFTSGPTRLWQYTTDPDSSVHNSFNVYAEYGELFINTASNVLFFCLQGGTTQVWTQICYTSQLNTALSSIPQANWTQSTISAQDYIKNKPTLATVATSGNYVDLSNKPTIPSAQIQSDWAQANTSSLDFIKNKPSLATVAITGSYNDLSNKPTFATVATSGAYVDLSGRPTLATVATSGLYSDLIGRPSLATVATSGSYNDLINKPTIPSGQIQSDWTQTNNASVDFIKNKPASRSQSTASRSLNTPFQISSTRDCLVNYSIDVATAATLLGGQVGTVFLEISLSSTFASGIQELARFVNGNSVSLAIAITLNQNVTGTMSGYVPSGYYCRLRTENTTGTPTFNYRSGQEVLL